MQYPVVLKTHWSVFVIFGIMFVGPTLPGLIGIVFEPDIGLALVIAIWLFIGGGGAAAWLLTYRIVVDQDGIEYRTLFKGEVIIPFDCIIRTLEEHGWKKYSDRFRPYHRFVIESTGGNAKQMTTINLKLLGKTEVVFLRNVLKKGFSSIDSG